MAYGWEAKLIASERSRVIWLGRQIPDQLQEVIHILGLTVTEVRDVKRINEKAADLFAVIVSANGDDSRKAAGRLLHLAKIMRILDYGVLLGVVSSDKAQAIRLRHELIIKFNDGQIDRAPIVALTDERDEFARHLRSHQPGPAADPNLNTPHQGHTQDYDHYESDSILLQRAFNGFTSINLTPQPGGFSKECKVWRVDAYRGSTRCEPFVAKAARRGDLEAEFNTYCDIVRNSVPFPYRAPLLEAQFVKGATRAILVSAFANRSERLDKYLATVSSPELALVSLFQEALGNWRRTAKSEVVSFQGLTGEDLELPNPMDIDLAYRRALKRNKRLPPPAQLCSQLSQLPAKKRFICRVHGDLNIRNVFVRWNTTNTVLIDFSNSGNSASLARDPSRLDTAIGLMARNSKNELLRDSTMRKLYQSPLLPPRNVVDGDGRIDAIRQIRLYAGGEGVASDEYEILTICHLLKFACKPTVKNRALNTDELKARRALSYALACGLFRNVKLQ